MCHEQRFLLGVMYICESKETISGTFSV